jgi:hypothetical protein
LHTVVSTAITRLDQGTAESDAWDLLALVAGIEEIVRICEP